MTTLPQVKLIALGETTSEGKKVTPKFIAGIYATHEKNDEVMFEFPNVKEIEESSKKSQSWFCIENEKGKVVGALSAQLEDERAENISWFISKPNMKGWIGRVYITPGNRGRRYIPAANETIVRLAKEKGLKKVFAYIHRKHVGSRKAFINSGFKKERLATARTLPASIIHHTKEALHGNWFQVYSKRIPRRK
jgi:L-amino acid N-acyltransferase YncA